VLNSNEYFIPILVTTPYLTCECSPVLSVRYNPIQQPHLTILLSAVRYNITQGISVRIDRNILSRLLR
jgi:hypothetical protein